MLHGLVGECSVDVKRREGLFDKMVEMMARVTYRRTELPGPFSSLTLYAGHIEGKDLGCPTVTHERGKEIIPRWI